MRFANVDITPETIARTREHFADICRQCISEANAGALRVNDLPGYIASETLAIQAWLSGEYDHTFTFAQRAHWLQTGECLPLLKPNN